MKHWLCNRLAICFGAIFAAGILPAALWAMGETATLPFPSGADGALSVAIDTSATYAYFGTNTNFATRARLSDFLQQSSVTLGGNSFTSVVIDSAASFAYFGSSETSPTINKVSLPNFVFVSSITFGTIGGFTAALEDSSNGFIYFATASSSSAKIIQVSVPDLVVTSTLTLAAGEETIMSAAIDKVNHIGYFGTMTAPGKVIKVNLIAMTKLGTLTLNSGENYLTSAVLSTTTGQAYFGTNTSPGRVVAVTLSSLAHAGALTLSSGSDNLTSAFIEPDGTNAYFGTGTSPGRIVRVRLSNLSEALTSTLATGEDQIRAAVIDPSRDLAYLGANISPGLAIQFDLLDTRTGPPLITSQPSGAVVQRGGTATFSVTAVGSVPITYQWMFNGAAIPGATSASYTTPALTFDDDGAAYSCVLTNSAGTTTSNTAVVTVMPVIRAYPNPWRGDRHSGYDVTFDGLAPNSTLKIFTLSMHWVKTIKGSDVVTWPLTNDAGQKVASGYYFYVITTHNDRQTVTGKLAVIK